MKKYDTAEIYEELDKQGHTPLKLREGNHVFDVQRRIVAQYKRTLRGEYYWEIWPTPSAPLSPEKLTNAYPLTEEVLFQFSLVEGKEKDKRHALERKVKDFNNIP